MSRLYRDQGIVLRTMRLGEADRIVTLMSAGRGKIRAVAKGVRKTKSRFGGRLEPTAHVAALFYEGRELDIITQAIWYGRNASGSLVMTSTVCASITL